MTATKPTVTYYVNTFNRVHLLKNLLLSFEACNMYDGPYEWIVTDYGSKDGTRDFLSDWMRTHKELTVVTGEQDGYAAWLKTQGVETSAGRKLMHAIFGKARNVALSIGYGEWFVELADDHQFIRPGDWITEAMNINEHRKAVNDGNNDISSILFRGLSKMRLAKANNARSPFFTTDDGIEYCLCSIKGYDDYHIMRRTVHDVIGPYMQVEELTGERLKRWNSGEDVLNHYPDYMERATALGYSKVFLRYPYATDFPNWVINDLNCEHDDLIVPLVSLEQMKEAYSWVPDPVSSDEVFKLAGKSYHVR